MTALRDKLDRLGVRRLLFAIHDASFPADPDEDLGRGAPGTRAAARLCAYVADLGFTGLQLGPQGQLARDNASPYDGTLFSRNIASITRATYAALLPPATLDRYFTAPASPTRADHARAWDAAHALLAAAYAAGHRAPAAFVAAQRDWLDSDARYFAHAAAHGYRTSADWPTPLPPPDPDAIARYQLGQHLAHVEHARTRATAAAHGLALYGDLQIGMADADVWAWRDAFLPQLRMGAPPSRTNPAGQPWNYPVLDPAQYAGRALAFVRARAAKAFAEHDGLRIDHPHGLICPWVYAPGTDVALGARLFESPDLPDLAPYAIARADQLNPGAARYADDWLAALEPAQVDRYAILIDAVVAASPRGAAALSMEVLSTMPRPLGAVLARHHLGRWRVTQKANLADPADVYRSENAAADDWVMLGNHDTAPIFAILDALTPERREAHARHLAARLALSPADTHRLADPGHMANAMLAELFASRAENVSIFFADLFGETARFNTPGVTSPDNWSLRLPPDFARVRADRLAAHRALDLDRAADLALAAPTA